MAVKLRQFAPIQNPREDSIISLGVTKRDYLTLLHALQELPGYETEIFMSSRYNDPFRGARRILCPPGCIFGTRLGHGT